MATAHKSSVKDEKEKRERSIEPLHFQTSTTDSTISSHFAKTKSAQPKKKERQTKITIEPQKPTKILAQQLDERTPLIYKIQNNAN